MILEPIGAEDAAALAAVHGRSFEPGWSAADIAALLHAPGGFGLAVREAEQIDGFLIGRAIAGEAEVLTLAVDPAMRRRGLARGLLEAALAAARAAGAEAMFLEVAADNTAAVALYAGAGFTRVGARPGYYRRPSGAIDALVMRRDLNSRPG
jgi:[ribosomal protein S18]-alanine N-acetyltransferase